MFRTLSSLAVASGLVASGLVVGSAHAAGSAPTVEVADAWSRPAAAGLPTGVAYATLVNHAAAADRLVSASSPVVGRVSVHRSTMTAGVMRMEPVPDGLELPPGRPVGLKPGGYHLMLSGLKGGLKLGQRYPMTFRFAHAHSVTVKVEVRSGQDAMPAMPAMH
jgi:periplasmic copper chaperone A